MKIKINNFGKLFIVFYIYENVTIIMSIIRRECIL